jgi:hypothetical protein
MISRPERILNFITVVGFFLFPGIQPSQGQVAGPTEWPRRFVRDGATNIVYQPQLDSWDFTTLKATSAVEIHPTGESRSTFGTIQFTATTRVDRALREVFFEKLEITSSEFPSAGEKGSNYLVTLRSLLPSEVKTISLDQLEASLAILEQREKFKWYPLRNDPPAILFSTKPAMLILVDGPPAYRHVTDTELYRVLNTRALILRDKSGKHYLHLFDGYMEAPTLNGPWTVCKTVTVDMKKAEKRAVEAKQVDLLAGQEHPETKKKPSIKSNPAPTLHVTTVPTELVVLQGEPRWVAIPTTQLLYATNTSSHVFKELSAQKTYILLSGRWFRSSGFEGPWEFVPAANLPPDFAKIPDESPKENVKASVPNTRQAQEAAIANNIPQTVRVERSTARMVPEPYYEGAPKLEPIEGTSLQYAANSPVPVIQSETNAWYACQSGVWFVGGSPTGPWLVATSVPVTIYSIPPGSPMHYVVYSRITNYDSNYVWVATTPGYYGTIMTADGLVVYGSGYVYPSYVGVTTYVSYPVTYGYACNPCWTPWAGWAYGFGVSWAWYSDWYWWYYCPPAPYWGPYWGTCYGAYYNAYGGITAWGPYGWAGTSGYIYHQNGPWTGVSRGAAGYNAWTGNQWATRYGRAYNSTTGTSAVGQRGAIQNVYTGNYAYGGRGAFYNENTGIAGAGGRVTVGNENTGNSVTAGRGTVYNPNTGNATHVGGIKGEQGGVINVNGNVIAGRDGNYYRPNGEGGWEQVTRPPGAVNPQAAAQRQNYPAQQNPNAQQRQWQPSNVTPQQRQSFNNEVQARQTGAQRQQSYQMHRPAPTYSRPAGGGFRGGGGRRR